MEQTVQQVGTLTGAPITEGIMSFVTIDNGVFLLIAILGMLGHAIKKYLAGQLSGTVLDYLIFHNPKRSALAFITTVGAALGLILGEQIPAQVGAFLMLAFTTGYTADSSVNKDDM